MSIENELKSGSRQDLKTKIIAVTKYKQVCTDINKPLGGFLGQKCEDIPYTVKQPIPKPKEN